MSHIFMTFADTVEGEVCTSVCVCATPPPPTKHQQPHRSPPRFRLPLLPFEMAQIEFAEREREIENRKKKTSRFCARQ